MSERAYDQAYGLRRLFAHHTVHLLPVAANPFARGAHMLLEGLCHGFAAQDLHTLVVDAAPSPYTTGVDVAEAVARDLDLGQWIDPLDAHTSVLAASPTLAWFGEAPGSAALLFEALREAAPSADVIVFHADAALLSGLFAGRRVRPLILAGDDAPSLTEAYAAIKILLQYAGLGEHAVVMDLATPTLGMPVAAARLAQCVQDFLGGTVHLEAIACTAVQSEADLARALHPLSTTLLHHALPFSLPDGEGAGWAGPAGSATAPARPHAFN
ncbi:MinD/ParA family protein [Caldimonas sp.]|uniref:MinD/ParA family ATP-binding protein n=1 Tax=Caldimonas sp. TaxID=2838790 RepID=UPI00391AD351